MGKRELDKELYHSTLDKVHAPKELSERVKMLSTDTKMVKQHTAFRRVAWAAAAVIALFVLSNVAVFAATGQPWVGQVFDWEKNPNQPHDNIREFFFENGELFDAPRGADKENYYGGTYLDGGVQVILLTDMSRSGEFKPLAENVRFEQCAYTYAELCKAMDEINAKLKILRRQGAAYADDVIGMGLNEKDNCVEVDIYYMTEEKTDWFKENVSDAAYLVFYDTHSLPQND